MTEMNAVQAWEVGLTLQESLAEYSDQEHREKYNCLAKLFTVHIRPDDLPKPTGPHPAPLLDYDPLQKFLEFQQVEKRAKADVVRRLKEGDLIGIGFAIPHYRRDPPVRIPSDMWEDDRVSWHQSELWHGSSVFEQVRVVKSAERTESSILAAIPDLTPRRRPGRPSRADYIKKAYRILRGADGIDFTSLEANTAPIQRKVKELSGNRSDYGLDSKTIWKAIGKEFASDKAVWKSKNLSKNSSSK